MAKLWRAFNIFEESIMVIGMAIMVFFNFANVVCRYLLPKTPFSYTEELVVLVFVWVSMFGISYGYRIKAHTVLTLVSDILPLKLQPILILFSGIASAILMLLIVDTGYGMVLNQMKFGQILPGMKIPVAVMGWAIPLGAAVTFVSILKSCFDEICELKKKK
ncbi:TRAP transporter small permease [uncultured Cloacibacillus sp.]|uniref:TRAP transporter small permease n=1 Tax=uncultured Cloacibacillus sp. TaxID=889794 RepID=UPI00261A2E22|nr:TRAP transporter small permease subunit [uncultured Cloacibacillus sp.]